MIFNLQKEERNKIISEIQNFFYEERDEEIGIIAAEEVLEFFLQNIGGMVYNKALDDAKEWFSKRLEEASIDYDVLYK